MKTEFNGRLSGKRALNNKSKSSAGLSDRAFYLIALTTLLKKELGLDSIEKFIAIDKLTDYRRNTI